MRPNPTLTNTILALERAALDRWGKGDPSGYLEICDPDVVYLDPFQGRALEGIEALTRLYEGLRGQIRIDRDEILDPTVQAFGDVPSSPSPTSPMWARRPGAGTAPRSTGGGTGPGGSCRPTGPCRAEPERRAEAQQRAERGESKAGPVPHGNGRGRRPVRTRIRLVHIWNLPSRLSDQRG